MGTDANGNRRDSVRREVLLGAEIAFAGTSDVIHCVVLDLSESGARLRTSRRLTAGGTLALPEQFELRIDGDAGVPVQLVRWSDDEIAVRFLTPRAP